MSIGPKQAIYAEFALVARALGSPHRLEMLEHLAQRERSVEALADRVGLTIANASQHLQHLRRGGLVASRREGKFVLYRLTSASVLEAMAALSAVATHNLAEVDRIRRTYFAERDSMEPVTRADLMEKLRSGLVTVLDVRPPDEFQTGHLPGAVNIPLGELEARLAELDQEKDIVAYCRGPWCVLSFEAVAMLRARRFDARRLQDGLPEWEASGLPVEHV